MRVYNCSEIFKESLNVTEEEINVIKKFSQEYKYNQDKANGYTAFALDFDDESKANKLVCELNNINDDWYVGDQDEEYVFTE